jgi:hypothetical protein
MNALSKQTRWPAAGSIVSVPAYVVFRHKGIVSDQWYLGEPMVISNSARIGHGAEEPWDVFSSGQHWADEGYLGNLSPHQVLERARASITKLYNPFTWNCDMFVTHAHGLPPTSGQLAVVLLAAAAVGIALVVSR